MKKIYVVLFWLVLVACAEKKQPSEVWIQNAAGEAIPAPAPVREQPKPVKGGYTEKELVKMEEDRRKVAELSASGTKEASGLEDLSVYEDDEI